ncbi:proline racemase family [Aspergillus fruticulosus]
MDRRGVAPIHIVGCHCGGEVCDVIVRGVLNPPGCTTMYEKLVYFRDKEDHIQQLLLQEPRGRPAIRRGFLIMESDEYPPMFGGSTIATAAVLLETGMLKMTEPGGRCKAVAFDNVPLFVFALDYEVDIPGFGSVSVDIAWGGMIYAVVDAPWLGLSISNQNGAKLIEYGERIKRALHQAPFVPVHPETPSIKCVSILEFTEPLDREKMEAVSTVVVSPGRFDPCPCGTGSCAQMAILHARGQLAVSEKFTHREIIGSSFECHIRGTERLGG